MEKEYDHDYMCGLLRNLCDEVWKNADKEGASGEYLFMPDNYNNASVQSDRPVVGYTTMMHFNADERVEFGFLFSKHSILIVDDKTVCGPSLWKHGTVWRRWYGGTQCFDKSGWHRVTVISIDGPGMNDYKMDEESGGVFYRRGDAKRWHRFEATPDGKAFRVTPDDIRRALPAIEHAARERERAARAIADIERAKQK